MLDAYERTGKVAEALYVYTDGDADLKKLKAAEAQWRRIRHRSTRYTFKDAFKDPKPTVK
jgi:hypothetical protein